ncbi:MAG TPA: cytochrome b5 domain-containing protein [Verrucomicrobiae bacterium]|nr:cytochrome b5 domain-containing protein [Verrucomicrobiae bacterium]
MAITRSELAKYDGKNGNPAYIAYEGRVYDVSKVFSNGEHNGCTAGMDLTDKLEAYHDMSILENGIVVGGIRDE